MTISSVVLHDTAASSQLNGVAFHVIVHIDVFLCDRDGSMPSQAGKYANADAFTGEVGNECSAPRMAAGASNACCAVQPEQVLGEHIG